MTIILDFRFAVFDRMRVRVWSSSFSLSLLVLAHGPELQVRREDKLKLELHARKPSRCNAVKPGQSWSNQFFFGLTGLTGAVRVHGGKICRVVDVASAGARAGNIWHLSPAK